MRRRPPALVVRGNRLPPGGMYLRSALGDPVRLQEEQSTSATDELCIGLERICPRLSDGRKASRPAEEADRHAFVRDVLVYVDHRRNELIVPACGVRLDIPPYPLRVDVPPAFERGSENRRDGS